MSMPVSLVPAASAPSPRATSWHRRLGMAIALAGLAALGGCAGRTLEVSTGEVVEGADATLVVTNPFARPMNLYVRPADGAEIFLRQLAASTTESIPVRGLGVGAVVRLRAASVDGGQAYTREGVVLSRGVTWRLGS